MRQDARSQPVYGPQRIQNPPSARPRHDLSQIVRQGLSAPAHPLSTDLRIGLEAQFDRDLSSIRWHSGVPAAASASLLSANAYTVGSHIVLGGRHQGLQASQSTLVHEVAHAVQQDMAEPRNLDGLRMTGPGDAAERSANLAVQGYGRMPKTGLAVARETAGSPTPTVASLPIDIEQLIRQFEYAAMLGAPDPAARQPAIRLLDHMRENRHWLQHGLKLTIYFLSQGMHEQATRALQATHDAWMLQHVTADPQHHVPRLQLSFLGQGTNGLIEQAEAAARSDRHELAFRVFGTAYQLISWQLDEAGPAREESLRSSVGSQQAASVTRAMFFYPPVRQAFDQLRRILGFYRRLSAEQRQAGNTRAAAYYSGLSLLLYLDIRDNYVWDSDSAMIAEVQHVPHARGGGALRIHGANGVDLDVTQLPGLPEPAEVAGTGGFTFQRQSVSGVTDALFGQVGLLADLQEQPAIQREFGSTPIDMNNLSHRLRVWRVMYGTYQQGDALGMGVLYRLMSLIGRYLRAFTIHTQYNVDDFSHSYLDNQMRDMPTDLAGRAERDCGVYALTVAYEVFRTARTVSPRLDLEFRLFAMPEHVTLVILDRDQNEFYIVNNDQVSPPRRGDMMQEVARAYAPIRGLRNLVAPAVEVSLGTTAMRAARFERRAWSQYQDSASWGIHVPPARPGDTTAPADRREAAYRGFYAAQRFYNESSPRLHALADRMVAALAVAGSATPLAIVRSRIGDLTQLAFDHGLAFETAGPFARIDTARPDPALQRRLSGAKRFLFLHQRTARAAPLARAAMALLHFQHLGGALDERQRAIIALADRVSAMHAVLQSYRRSGFPATF